MLPGCHVHTLAVRLRWKQFGADGRATLEGTLPDITQGATLYYNPSGIGETANKFTLPGGGMVHFPDGWNENAVAFTVEIAQQLFFRERSS